ncbi:hypothetical protein BHF71_04710 [Vulcanibacillus modesticaldus]|uniref:Uncharacterized protein n=1 Tax=Vulcanibacillus modesticaldus TaxID=337097 RepID=A0A1D2YS41_9BACI|nr:hypothetical protein [Vulcanibacillus modesticaldus]OEF96458.1 hypothetical protein BHF71_04710 [Vulcanibacillus modesticaldus]
MLGFLFNDRECKELEYILRRELDEMLLDLSDYRIDGSLKKAIEDRYHIIFKMYSRFGNTKELSKYARSRQTH